MILWWPILNTSPPIQLRFCVGRLRMPRPADGCSFLVEYFGYLTPSTGRKDPVVEDFGYLGSSMLMVLLVGTILGALLP